jgi:cytochrome c oxidase subunit 1
MDWLTTVDHKKIGIMYLIAGTVFLAIAGIEALLIRIQLMYPMNDFLDGQTFNQLITMHGATMLFLAATPLLFGFMNYIVPLQIGARDVAFPFINALGFWTFLAGGILLNVSFIFGGAPDAGWTAYTPLSTEYSGKGMDFFVIGLQISGIGTLLSGINFLVTIINLRAPGMTFMRLPLFTWTSFIMSLLILFAFTALAVGLVLITFDRLFDANFFRVGAGGNTVLWQHIFWIFGHPEVYILIMPAFGIISDVIPTFAKKRLFGYSSMVFAVVLIGFLSFMVWVHHMFTDGLGPVANALFGIATMLIAIPTGIKVFNWLFTMWGGQLTFNTASMFAYSFIPTFVMGGVTGVMLASPPADFQYHDTYFVVAHFHYVIVGGIVLALFAGLFYWYPRIFGRMLHEGLGKITFWVFYTGFHLTFFIQHFLGLWGMPRRVYTYLPDQGWDIPNLISSIGAFMMGFAVVVLVINIIITHARKADAPADPWDGRTMEWALPSPVPVYNFKQTPLVRGLDAFWKEKMAGNKEMTPAEPIGPIHMPNGSIIPLIMSIGILILGVGIMYANYDIANSVLRTLFHNHIITAIGFVITFGSMVVHSLYDDPGYHIEVDQLDDKGVKA